MLNARAVGHGPVHEIPEYDEDSGADGCSGKERWSGAGCHLVGASPTALELIASGWGSFAGRGVSAIDDCLSLDVVIAPKVCMVATSRREVSRFEYCAANVGTSRGARESSLRLQLPGHGFSSALFGFNRFGSLSRKAMVQQLEVCQSVFDSVAYIGEIEVDCET